MNDDDARRQRAGHLARRLARSEAEALCSAAEPVLPKMSEAILAAEALGHPELREKLVAIKALWRRTVYDYGQALQRSAHPPAPSNLHTIALACVRDGVPFEDAARHVMHEEVLPDAS